MCRAVPCPAHADFSYICPLNKHNLKSFEHLIITRFNLNLYARDKHDAPTRTERWLEHRFEIFERYCLPSVAAQTNPNFRWLCLFDAATPAAYRRRIGGYQSVCPQFRSVFYSAGQAGRLTESLRTTISGLLAGREELATPPLRSC